MAHAVDILQRRRGRRRVQTHVAHVHTDALAISFTFKRWFTTVFRLSAATVSRGGSRLGAPARRAHGFGAPATFTSSVHQDACDAEGTETPLSASHEGPITRDFTIRCSSAPVCVPSAHTKDAPRVSAGSGAASAGYRTLSTCWRAARDILALEAQ